MFHRSLAHAVIFVGPLTSFSLKPAGSNLAQKTLLAGIQQDSPAIIREAISSGANLNSAQAGQEPIVYAVLLKKSAAVETLLQLGARADVVYMDKSLAHHAFDANEMRIMGALVRSQAARFGLDKFIDQYLNNFLSDDSAVVLNRNNERRIKSWAASCNEVNLYGFLSKNKHLALKLLLQYGCRSKSCFATVPLRVLSKDIEGAIILLCFGYQLKNFMTHQHKEAGSFLHNAANVLIRGRILSDVEQDGLLELLVNYHGITINGKTNRNNLLGPLFAQFGNGNATLEFYRRMIQFCLKMGLDLNQVLADGAGSSYSFFSLFQVISMAPGRPDKAVDMIKMLAEFGVDINKSVNFHDSRHTQPGVPMTPLYYAMKIGEPKTIACLIELGASL